MNLQPPTLVAVFCIKGVTKVSEVKIDQKINQNILSMIIGAAFIGLEQRFALPDCIYYVGWGVMMLSAIFVFFGLIAYSINYWNRKMYEIKGE